MKTANGPNRKRRRAGSAQRSVLSYQLTGGPGPLWTWVLDRFARPGEAWPWLCTAMSTNAHSARNPGSHENNHLMIEERVIPDLNAGPIGSQDRESIEEYVILVAASRMVFGPTNAEDHEGVGHGFSEVTMKHRASRTVSLTPTVVPHVQLLSIIEPDEPPRRVGLDQTDEFINSRRGFLIHVGRPRATPPVVVLALQAPTIR